MGLEQLQVSFNYQEKNCMFALQELKESDPKSLKLNGRPFAFKGNAELRALLEKITPNLFAEKMLSAFELRQILCQCEGVSDLTVSSSLGLSDRVNEMEQLIQAMVEQENFHGAVLVKSRGKRLLSKGFGYADEKSRPITLQTRFYIGSLTKQFTGIAILQLVEQGQLSLEDKVNDLLPKAHRHPRWQGISLGHLVSMSAGILDYFCSLVNSKTAPPPFQPAVVIESLAQTEPLFAPGKLFDYSNSCYFLLGLILEEFSKENFSSYLQKQLLDRLGMANTGLFSSFPLEENAWGHCLDHDNKKIAIPPQETANLCSYAFAAGGFVSSIDDLDRWDSALNDPAFLTDAAYRLMEKTAESRRVFIHASDPNEKENQTQETDPQARYSFGFYIDGEGDTLYHGGQVPGSTSFLVRNRATQDCIIVLSNQHYKNSPTEPLISEWMASQLWEILQR